MEVATRSLGRYVRRRREMLGLSQGALGEKIGREQKWISELERGALVNLPPPEIVRGLADALNCLPADLLIAAGYLERDDPTPAMLEVTFIHELRGDAESLRGQVESLIRRIAIAESDRAVVVNGG